MIKFSESPIKLIAGWTLVAVGIAGLFLPLIQGIALIVLGVVILKSDYVLKFVKNARAKWRG